MSRKPDSTPSKRRNAKRKEKRANIQTFKPTNVVQMSKRITVPTSKRPTVATSECLNRLAAKRPQAFEKYRYWIFRYDVQCRRGFTSAHLWNFDGYEHIEFMLV